MAWIYSQDSGWLSHNGAKLIQCYSGSGSGKNNPDAQQLHNIGPIPCGSYTMQAPVDTTQHGPYVIWLVPDPENSMFNRSDFGIHGERKPPAAPGEASEGCIIEPYSDRVQVWSSGDHRLLVVSSMTTEDALWPNG